jgi:glycosyltransferase involved in cell wall biosynthesis
MISFIVIGKNESSKIFNCISSIVEFISFNAIVQSEIIYVDSNSSDDSIEYALQFPEIKIVKISGEINAAIGRNVGSKFASGDFLYFIDGDMEICKEFYFSAFDETGNMKYDFVSGEFLSYYYKNDKLVSVEPYHKISHDVEESTTGGIFIIKNKLWSDLNGMNPKYRRCQDLDFGLRMSNIGFKLLRKSNIIANHHTISYYDNKRLWQDLFNFNQLYQKSVLYRDHLTNKFIYKFLVREISLGFFTFSLLFLVFTGNVIFLLFFPVVIFFKVLYKGGNSVSNNWLVSFSYYLLLDVFVFLGFFFFWPTSKKRFTILKVNF